MLTEPDAIVERRELARRVTSARIVAGLSRADLARAAQMEARRLEQVETGHAAPSETELRHLAAACGVEYGELIPPGYHLTLAIGAAVLGSHSHETEEEQDRFLREYLRTVMELRRTPVKLATIREEDIAELATVLGTTPADVSSRLGRIVASLSA
ncbi:MAG: helix-turn-helix transcriptional regulator [Acidimicrobiia bacterium]